MTPPLPLTVFLVALIALVGPWRPADRRSPRGRRRPPRASAAAAAVVGWLAAAGAAAAASPAPSQAPIGDPRAGQTPAFVGDPAFAVLAVAVIAIVAVAATMAWVRATGGPGGRDRPGA